MYFRFVSCKGFKRGLLLIFTKYKWSRFGIIYLDSEICFDRDKWKTLQINYNFSAGKKIKKDLRWLLYKGQLIWLPVYSRGLYYHSPSLPQLLLPCWFTRYAVHITENCFVSYLLYYCQTCLYHKISINVCQVPWGWNSQGTHLRKVCNCFSLQ